MKRALLSLVTLTLCAGVIAAQEKPGFSGRAAVDKIFARVGRARIAGLRARHL